ncbi:hypothetical protein M673_19585 (plasmid) [Aureimonas sp. AU20]|nr:hypothetical protein M673_19585 [Aureimonas sp. AU20]
MLALGGPYRSAMKRTTFSQRSLAFDVELGLCDSIRSTFLFVRTMLENY